VATTHELPIDRLRAGTMTDAEVVEVAAETVRMSHVHGHGEALFALLAARLRLVHLSEPQQTRPLQREVLFTD
jgi:hypothetical protein